MMKSVLHAFGAQRAHGGLADVVRRQPRDVITLEAEQREADGHVRLSAAEGRTEHRRLKKPLVSGRAEPQHDLAECHDLRHVSTS